MADDAVVVPAALVAGVPMLKMTSKKIKQVLVRLEDGAIAWASRSNRRGGLPS